MSSLFLHILLRNITYGSLIIYCKKKIGVKLKPQQDNGELSLFGQGHPP